VSEVRVVVGKVVGVSERSGLEHSEQSVTVWRGLDVTTENLLGSGIVVAVELSVGLPSLHQHGALQRHSSEQTLSLGVGEDGGHIRGGSRTGGLGISTKRSGSQRHVSSKCDVSGLREGVNGLSGVKNEDEVRELGSNLASNSGTSCDQSRRSRPASVGKSRNDDSRASSARKEETGLEHGQNDKTLGVLKNMGRNDHVLAENLVGLDKRSKNLGSLTTLAS
jgi:hypothetical protein